MRPVWNGAKAVIILQRGPITERPEGSLLSVSAAADFNMIRFILIRSGLFLLEWNSKYSYTMFKILKPKECLHADLSGKLIFITFAYVHTVRRSQWLSGGISRSNEDVRPGWTCLRVIGQSTSRTGRGQFRSILQNNLILHRNIQAFNKGFFIVKLQKWWQAVLDVVTSSGESTDYNRLQSVIL